MLSDWQWESLAFLNINCEVLDEKLRKYKNGTVTVTFDFEPFDSNTKYHERVILNLYCVNKTLKNFVKNLRAYTVRRLTSGY